MERKIDIDILRIIACFSVIYHHSAAYEYFVFSDVTGVKYWIHLFLCILCCLGVPLFFEISGALLFEREPEKISRMFRRFFRMFLILTSFSFLFYLDYIKRNNGNFNFIDFLVGLYQNQWNYAYWYIYAYLLMILLLPFNQMINKCLKNRPDYVVYLIFITIFYMALLPYINLSMGNKYELYNSLVLPETMIYISIIPLLGSWFYNSFEITRNSIRVWCVLSFIGIAISSWATYLKQGIDIKTPQDYFMSMTVFSSITIMLLVRRYAKHDINKKISNIIHFVGKATSGVYLIHVLFVTNYQWDDALYYWLIDHNVPHIISGGLSVAIIMGVCLAIVMPIQLIISRFNRH